MNNLSIVFQGPADVMSPALYRGLQRTRDTFPDAEIIVSTWHRTPMEDRLLQIRLQSMQIRLILSVDPGPLTGTDTSGCWTTNLNRLLCSARAGLAAVSHPLVIKLRTDTWLSSRTLLALLEQDVLQDAGPPRKEAFRVFSHRVINASWFARDPKGSLPFLFHPGDILLAGRTEDVRLFFSAPLADMSLFCPARMPGLWIAWRYVPEQWFWVHAIHQATGRRVYEGNFSHTPALATESEQFYLANFVPYSPGALGLHWPKYWRSYPFRGLFSVYTHSRWCRRAGYGRSSPVREIISRGLTALWRNGYRLRAVLLRHPGIRRVAKSLFSHRGE
ncbi:WavE lipopolysaccharide synthesis family protein [Klebsiella aerogenes]